MEIFKRAIGRNDILRVIRIRSFLFMMISEFFSQLAFNMQHFVLILIIYELTRSNTAISGFILGSIGRKFKSKWISSIGFMTAGIIFILFPYGSKVTAPLFVQVINSYLPHILDINRLHLVVVLAFLIGIAISFVFVPANATIQIETSDEIRGRIYGFLNALIGAVSFLPVVLAGGLADLLGVGTVITSFGIFMLALSVFFYIFD